MLLWKTKEKIPPLVHTLVLMLLVLALARPIEKQVLQEVAIDAKDVIIALDVSYSMRGTDILPTRYDFAKETINQLLTINPSDNIMLIAFTTNPLLLSPPTTDHALISVALESLNPDYILTQGTSLKRLFEKLSTLSKGDKNIILLSDGGEESDVATLSALVQNAHLSLHVLALGSKQGTTIQTKEGKMLKDKEGNLVISRINPLLETLAQSTQGTYHTASSSPKATALMLDKALQQAHHSTQQIQKMQKMQSHAIERYPYPLALALLLFLMVHTRVVKYLIVFFALFGLQVEASILDDYHLHRAYSAYHVQDFQEAKYHLNKMSQHSLQSKIALAHTHYRQREFKQAIKLYKSIRSTSLPIKQQLYYHIGNAYAMLEAYDKAKIYYAKSLQLGEEKDTLFNARLIALLHDKKDASLGIAHPKSQSSQSSKSESQEKDDDPTREEDQPSSGSGGGEESASKETKEITQLTADNSTKKQPLGSKVYELINKGYIREKQPW